MLKRMAPEIPIILSVIAQFLAVLAALWLIWPLRLGPIAYSDANVSIVDAEGLGVLPELFAPSALILVGTFSLYLWATRGSRRAEWVAWLVCSVLLLGTVIIVSMPFFVPAAVTMLLATELQRRIYRNIRS